MSDDGRTVKYEVSGDASPYVAAMNAAARATTEASAGMKAQLDKVSNAFATVQKQVTLVAGIVAGGSFFKEAIAASAKLSGEAMSLSKRLGITGDEAAALNTALGDIGSDSETYIGAFDKFAKQLKTNEDGLQAMGLQTRDSNGHLRDSKQLFQEALGIVGQYKPGLDQTTAAMTLFGKGVDEAMKLQKLNNKVLEDAKQKNEDLGLTLTKEGVQASKEYKAAMNDVGDVLTAVQNAIGQAVMPVFTELGNFFAQSGPYMVLVFKGALTVLLGAFEAVKATVKTVGGVIFEAISLIVDGAGLLGEVFSKLFSGDFSGAYDAAKRVGERVGQAFTGAFKNFVESGNDAESAMQGHVNRMFSKGTAVAAPSSTGKKTMGEFGSESDKKDKAAPSFMKYYELQLEEERRVATEKDALRGMSKQEEQAYWQNLLDNAKLTATDQVAVQKKLSEARIEVLKQEAQNANELGKIALESWQTRELGKVAAQQEAAQNEQQLGQITQAQLLAQEEQFELRRQQIRTTALEAELATLDPTRDPVQVAQTHAKLEQLEIEHQQRLRQIRGQLAVQSAQEQGKVWADLSGRMSSLWDQGVNAMINGTLTWSSAFKALGAQILGWFATSIIKPMVTKWLIGEQAKTAATTAGTAERLVLEGLAAAKSVLIWAATAAKNIMANAWAAMAAAWQAIAGIPVVGPALAVGAAAATFAGVAALAGHVLSAEGGMDIPAGVNPLTQLHEKEMVLPAKHADVIRGLSDGSGSAGGAVNFNLNAVPLRGGFFMAHRDDLVAAVKSAQRDRAL